jgi:hypothetical protein
VRVLLSGGAPLAPDTHEYLKAVLCIQILQVVFLLEGLSDLFSGILIFTFIYSYILYQVSLFPSNVLLFMIEIVINWNRKI